MSIEIERLSLINEEQYTEIKHKLEGIGAENVGKNNTITVFFHPEDSRVKVQKNTSKGSAKIVWKSGGSLEGISKRTEIELPINPEDFERAVELVRRFMPEASFFSPREQKRHDYRLDGVNIAVKYSDDFGYHIELDMNVGTEDSADNAMIRIERVAERIGIRLLSVDEESRFLEEIKSR